MNQILVRPSLCCPRMRVCRDGWLSIVQSPWHQSYYSKRTGSPWKNQFEKTSQSSSTKHLPWCADLPRPDDRPDQPGTRTIHSYRPNHQIHQRQPQPQCQPQTLSLAPHSRPCLHDTCSIICKTWRRQELYLCWTQHWDSNSMLIGTFQCPRTQYRDRLFSSS